MRLGRWVGTLVAIALGCGAPAASAAPTWLAPFDLDGPMAAKPNGSGGYLSSTSQALVGQDDNGDVLVLTREWDGSNVRVALVQRLRDGTIHRQLVSPAGTDVNGFVQLAVAATGAVIVGWQTTASGPLTVATGQAGQDLVVAPSYGVVSTYMVAAGQGGDLAVAFTPSLNAPVQVARQAPGGSLGAPAAIVGSSGIGQFVAMTPGGETVVAWTKGTLTPTNRVTYEVDWVAAARGAAFSAPALLPGSAGTPPSSDNSANGGQASSLVSDGAGTVYAVYSFGTRSAMSPLTLGDVYLATRPAGGAFAAGVIIPGTHLNEINIGGALWADRAGDLLFSQSLAGKVFVRKPGAAWSAGADPHAGDGFSGGTGLTMGPTGAAGAAYQPSTSATMVERSINLDGTIGAAQTIATLGGSELAPGIGFDAEGDGVVAWGELNSTTGKETVRAAAYDAAGPRLSAVSIPATATVGDTLAFSLSASDAWSAVSSFGWDFGDGSAAGAGASVSHAYGAAGAKSVTATATDAVGNASTATGTVTVAAAPVVAPPVPTVPADKVAPKIKHLTMTPRTFAVAPKAAVLSAVRRKRHHRGTTIAFTLSEKANVTFSFVLAHVRKEVKPKRYVLRRKGVHKGKVRLTFTGRIGKHALGPGRYRMTVVAVDAAHNKSGPAKKTFRIVRR